MDKQNNLTEKQDNDNKSAILQCVSQFNTWPNLSQSFPLTLSNAATVDSIMLHCTLCHTVLEHDYVHGNCHTLANVIMVDAIGYCEQCNCMHVFHGRVKPHKQSFALEMMTNNQWTRYEYTPTPQGIFGLLGAFFRKIGEMFKKQ